MAFLKNKKGLYEYVLVKTVMLIFIFGLVVIFGMYLNNIGKNSAVEIAQMEADRVAKEIDNAMGFKGMSNTMTVQLARYLTVGAQDYTYELNITDQGYVVIHFTQYPYNEILGVSSFGTDIIPVGGPGVKCKDSQLYSGAYIIVSKATENSYEPCIEPKNLPYKCFVTTAKIDFDASASCIGTAHFEERYENPVKDNQQTP